MPKVIADIFWREDALFGTGWCSGMGSDGWLFMTVIWGGFLAVAVRGPCCGCSRAAARPRTQPLSILLNNRDDRPVRYGRGHHGQGTR
jgi:hypothetical protein